MTMEHAMQHRVLPSLFKWYPWIDHDIFYGKVKFGPWCFCWSPILLYGKQLKQRDFSETIVIYDIKVGRCTQLNDYMKLYGYQRSRSFIELVPNHSDSICLNFFSSITTEFNISSALRWAIRDQWSSGLEISCMVLISGCPIYMTKEEVYDKLEPLSQKEKEMICSTLFYCINWFVEVGYHIHVLWLPFLVLKYLNFKDLEKI